MFFHHENPHEATNGFVKAVTLQIFSKFSNVKFSPHCDMLRIFHKFFFENLNVPIPAFLTAKKFGLLRYGWSEHCNISLLHTKGQPSLLRRKTRPRPNSPGPLTDP